MINPQSANRQISTKLLHNAAAIAQRCRTTVLKVIFLHDFYNVHILIRTLYAEFVREYVCICRLAKVLCPQIPNRLGPQIANPQSV
jgi:hypothetical protein